MKSIISVIVPVYNVEMYLKKCINSILNQTLKKLEIILVDDGSTDNSGIICDEYKFIDKRIKVIHKENGGLSSARNIGIDNATGDYLAFIDSDDWIEPNMIEVLFDMLEKNDSDISICEFIKCYDENVQPIQEEIKIEIFNNIDALKKLYDENKGIYMTIACNKLYKRNLLEKVRFPLGKIHEDEFFIYKVLYEANKISYINRKMYYYRQRENSIMNSRLTKKRLDAFQAFDERIEFIKNKINDKELYSMSISSYYKFIIAFYILYKKDNYNDYITIKQIKVKANEIYKIYFKISKESLKLKIIYSSFYINPILYTFIEKISKIKKKIKM